MNKPVAPKGQTCPFHRKDVSKVCHTCPLYVHVRGVDQNTGQEVDHWDCSFSWMPMLLIENSGMQRRTGAAVESFRNEMLKSNSIGQQILLASIENQEAPMKLIEAKEDE